MCLFEVSLLANKALQAVQIIWATLTVFLIDTLGIERGDAATAFRIAFVYKTMRV
jgi:hypothetical protein